MSGYAVKPTSTYVAKKEFSHKLASVEYKRIAGFINTHVFSFSVDIETGGLNCKITSKEE